MIAALVGGVRPSGAVFIEAHFDGTNKMLDKARAAGTYLRNRAKRSPYVQRLPLPSDFDKYAAEVARVRRLGKQHAPDRERVSPVWLGFVLIGHRKLDPAAWYLPAKAIEDGLVDAGFVDSDRFEVLGTLGTVCLVPEEEARAFEFAGFEDVTGHERGMLVMWWDGDALAQKGERRAAAG